MEVGKEIINTSIEVFFSYAHEDEELCKKLEKHLRVLKRLGTINIWHDRHINAGSEWKREIEKHLNTAQIILLLVSSDFMASDYCYNVEMKRAIERHKRGEARVIPIILRPAHWEGTPLRQLQALPINGMPITNWDHQDKAFSQIAQEIKKVVQKLQESSKSQEGKLQEKSKSVTSLHSKRTDHPSVAPPAHNKKPRSLATSPDEPTQSGKQTNNQTSNVFHAQVQGVISGGKNTIHFNNTLLPMEDAAAKARADAQRGYNALRLKDYVAAKRYLEAADLALSEDELPTESAQIKYYIAIALLNGQRPFSITKPTMQYIDQMLSSAIKFHLLILLDPHLCEILYIILLLVEAYLIGRPKRSKKNYFLLILWAYLSISFLFSLANARNVGNTIDYFYLFCAILHLYPLYTGVSLVYTAIKKEKINLKQAEQKNLQKKRDQRKKEQQKSLEQKRAEQKNLQEKKLQQILPPTDQEFDAWLESRVRERLTSTLRKLGLDDQIANHRQLLRVRGYVLPGMKDAHHYRRQDLRYKLGADGKRRYSLNLYTYFYPAEHQIMVFTYEINAMNWNDGRETTKEYFYHDVIGAETVDDHDKLFIEDKSYSYRTQSFRLKLCDGTGISATVRSRPLDDMTSLPIFDIPQSDLDDTIAQLRMLLRTKKA